MKREARPKKEENLPGKSMKRMKRRLSRPIWKTWSVKIRLRNLLLAFKTM